MKLLKKSSEFFKSLPVRLFESVIKKEVDSRFTAANVRTEEDRTWRRITDVERRRDLPPLKHDKMIRIVDYLHDRNPLAKKILRLTADFVIGEGVVVKADEVKGRETEQEELQEIIDRFWTINQWDLKQFDRVEELGKYGEQIYKPFVNDFDGTVKLGVFDPEQVNKIEADIDNKELLVKLIPKTRIKEDDKAYDIIRPQPLTAKNEETGEEVPTGKETLKGDIFFFPVNKGSHATRGKSDLLAIADWLDMWDRTLYTMTERVTFLLSFIWQIVIEGADKPQLDARKKELELNPPLPGSFQVTNDKEKWNPNTPDLGGRNLTDFFNLISRTLTGGSGYPEHWLFGRGEDVNKASASEMAEPTLRQLERRQKYVRFMFRQMIDYQIQQKIDKGFLKGTVEDYPYSVIIPEPSKKEASLIADTMQKMTPALAIATTNNFLSSDTATKVLSMLVSQLGVETNAEDEGKKTSGVSESKLYEALQRVAKELKADIHGRSKAKEK